MPLSLADAWLQHAIRIPEAARDGRRLLEQAAATGVDATLIAAPELTTSGRSCLAHWTGQELAVVELTAEQQQGLGIRPGTLIEDLEPRPEPQELPPLRRVSLVGVRFEGNGDIVAHQPLRGTLSFELPQSSPATELRCALRGKYFRPGMPVRRQSLAPVILTGRQGAAEFAFEPLSEVEGWNDWQGPVVLFLQLVTLRGWSITDTCQRISNVLVRILHQA